MHGIELRDLLLGTALLTGVALTVGCEDDSVKLPPDPDSSPALDASDVSDTGDEDSGDVQRDTDRSGDTASDGGSDVPEDRRDSSTDGGGTGDAETDAAGGDDTCGGISGETCDSGEWCDYPDDSCGDADAQGTCRDVPVGGCPDKDQPVCGCDGKTYANPCRAHAAGVDVAQSGECTGGPCGGDRCGPDEVCTLPKGECGASEKKKGTCEPSSQNCPTVEDPVCGCDGTTYPNACRATASGTSIAHDGPCNTGRCGGKSCGSDQFCSLPDGQCGADKQKKGSCKKIPRACKAGLDPVCGCDGKTYNNSCRAAANGANIDHEGSCKSSSACGGKSCGSDQFCSLPDGQCGADKRKKGSCKDLPKYCKTVIDPVCGCDGKTYNNPCRAASNGANIDHKGSC